MTDPRVVAGILLAISGLVALFLRLQREFDRTIAMLVVLLVAGATPLLATLRLGVLSEAGLFAALAIASSSAAVLIARPLARTALVVGIVAIVPVIAPDVAVRPTLFAPWNGFLALTPVVYVAVIGAAARFRIAPADAAAAVVALAIWPLTQTSLVPVLALLAPGLGTALAWARTRPVLAAAPMVLAVIVWNYWLMVQYTAGTIPKDAPVSFAAMVRQQGDVATRDPFVYPFAFPGNLLAAWREGIPLSRYDLLSGEPAREQFELRFDRSGDRFLLDGWGPLGSTSSGSFRLLDGPRATAVFPFRHDGGAVDIAILAAADVPTEAEVLVNGNAMGRLQIAAGAPTESRLRIDAAGVGRILRAGYNRLTIVTPGSRRIAIYRLRLAPAA